MRGIAVFGYFYDRVAIKIFNIQMISEEIVPNEIRRVYTLVKITFLQESQYSLHLLIKEKD